MTVKWMLLHGLWNSFQKCHTLFWVRAYLSGGLSDVWFDEYIFQIFFWFVFIKNGRPLLVCQHNAKSHSACYNSVAL